MEQVLNAILAILLGVGGLLAYFFGTNYLLDTAYADTITPDGRVTKSNAKIRQQIRPWLFVFPALFLLSVFLVYPAVRTVYLSFFNDISTEFVGFDNYTWAVGDEGFQQAVVNNLLWLIVVPFMSTAFGLIVAVLSDRVRWERVAKSFIFLPMAISFVGAAIIWRFVYAFRELGDPQIGMLNQFVTQLGGDPLLWVNDPPLNSFALMVILVWIQTGFAMVLLSAALKGVPEETLEAARMDGANEVQIFFRVMIPQIWSTIVVVMTTIVIVVLKVFDIVFAMTGGQFDTEVLGNLMYTWMFRNFDFGRGSMIAVAIMVAVMPIMVWNMRNFWREEQIR